MSLSQICDAHPLDLINYITDLDTCPVGLIISVKLQKKDNSNLKDYGNCFYLLVDLECLLHY